MPAPQAIKGYTADEIVGQHFSRFYTEEDRAARRAAARRWRPRSREGKYEKEAWRVRKDGTRFWASVVIDPIYDEDGELSASPRSPATSPRRRDAAAGAGGGARRPVPVAEAAGARRADRRHRPRFQQSDDRHPRLGRPAAPRRPHRGEAQPLSRRDHRHRRPRRDAHQPPARLRPAPGAQARGDRPQPAPRRLRRDGRRGRSAARSR